MVVHVTPISWLLGATRSDSVGPEGRVLLSILKWLSYSRDLGHSENMVEVPVLTFQIVVWPDGILICRGSLWEVILTCSATQENSLYSPA